MAIAKKGTASQAPREESKVFSFEGERDSFSSTPKKKDANFFFPLLALSSQPSRTLATGNKKTHLLDSERIGLHRVFGQEAAGAAVGEGVGRRRERREGQGRRRLLLRLRFLLLLNARDRRDQKHQERHEARPEPLLPALPQGQRRQRSLEQDDLGERRRRRAALESSRGRRGMQHIFLSLLFLFFSLGPREQKRRKKALSIGFDVLGPPSRAAFTSDRS